MVAKRNLRRIEELETTLANQAKALSKLLELPDSWLRELNGISGLVNDLLPHKARDYSRVPDADDQDPYAQLTELRMPSKSLTGRSTISTRRARPPLAMPRGCTATCASFASTWNTVAIFAAS